jgi:sec-independent protein translocase protein TatB
VKLKKNQSNSAAVMFDISFSELLVVAVVALIVIGPEKLPKVARTLGAISGRMQRYIAQVKDEVNRETRFEDLQKLQSEIQASANVAEQKIRETIDNPPSLAETSVSSPQQNTISEPAIEPPVNAEVVVKPVRKRTKKAT